MIPVLKQEDFDLTQILLFAFSCVIYGHELELLIFVELDECQL
jgi:hypothetical protein